MFPTFPANFSLLSHLILPGQSADIAWASCKASHSIDNAHLIIFYEYHNFPTSLKLWSHITIHVPPIPSKFELGASFLAASGNQKPCAVTISSASKRRSSFAVKSGEMRLLEGGCAGPCVLHSVHGGASKSCVDLLLITEFSALWEQNIRGSFLFWRNVWEHTMEW